MKQIIDYLLNSYQHCESIKEDAKFLAEATQSNLALMEQLITDWIHNKENVRLDLELNYAKNSEFYEEQLKKFINQYSLWN